MHHNPYSDLVKQLKTVNPQDANFGRRLNELININELLTTLNTARSLEETLDIILLTILGQYGCRKGAIIIKNNSGWTVGNSKGIRNHDIDLNGLPEDPCWKELPAVIRDGENVPDVMKSWLSDEFFQMILPARNEDKLVGLICLGKSLLGPAAAQKADMLSTIADLGGVIIGNSLYRGDLEQMNRQLQRQIFQLNTLYEITGSFSRCYEDEAVFQILSNNLMGQFFISRCSVLNCEDGFEVLFMRGLKSTKAEANGEQKPLDQWDNKVHDSKAVICEKARDFMRRHRLKYALPITSENKPRALLFLGARLDRKELSEADKDFILSLAEQSAVALENVRMQKEMLEKKRMEKELQLAREIQQRLLPTGVPVIDGYELAVEMRPYYEVGGDFYDFITMDDGKQCICLADVSGKSLPASMIMSTAQASLRALNSFPGLSLRDVIERLNLHMYQSTQSNKFITMFYAVLDPVTHQMQYINCGHNHPFLVRPDKTIEYLGLGGMVVGLFPRATYKMGTVAFTEGTELLIYTDGLSEVTDPSGEEYGDDRLLNNLLQKLGCDTAEKEKNEIIEEVMKFSCNKMVDDMTLMLIRRKCLPCVK